MRTQIDYLQYFKNKARLSNVIEDKKEIKDLSLKNHQEKR